jgi:predicted nucleic acid-binding protein
LARNSAFTQDCLILDASCVINLYASGQMGEILEALSRAVTVAAYVFEKEALWIYDGPKEDVRQIKAQIDLHPFVEAGLLQVVDLESETELEAHINLAAKLDLGEAITAAIAINRSWSVAIDDRKARAVLQREVAQIQLFYTLELVKYWVDTVSPSQQLISTILGNIQARAVYEPGRNHPLYSWWKRYI